MITIIDRVILYQRATFLVLFNDSQMNSGLCLRPGGLFCCWYATCSALTTIRRAPVLKSAHLVLWAPTDSSCCCHQVSSWALSTSHRSVMRLNWRFSLTFASFNVLNPIGKAYSIRASCAWHSDPDGSYLVWPVRSQQTNCALVRALKSVSHPLGIGALQQISWSNTFMEHGYAGSWDLSRTWKLMFAFGANCHRHTSKNQGNPISLILKVK